MEFRSTRGAAERVGFSTALLRGLAPDGGLYVPIEWPRFSIEDFDGAVSLAEVGERLLAPFARGDRLEAQMPAILRDAFDFPAPRHLLRGSEGEGGLQVLELFHGPTAAFKDFGARFLAACFERLRDPREPTLNILVATSGDTGGAVAAAFHRRSGLAVTVLFPKGLVSPTQQRQLTCWGDNVRSFAVRGTFDDCQRMVKEAFVDAALRSRQQLSSANSINLGRLLPQAVYYAMTSLEWWRARHSKLSFIIPSGNLGNAVACIWARHMGLPIGDVLLAHNANQTVPDYLASGEWQPRSSRATLASAMDVGHPSNMERLRDLYPRIDSLRDAVTAVSIDDAAIEARVRADYARYGEIWCPHTAVGAEAWARLTPEARRSRNWCVVSTASPAKFPEIVEPLIGGKVPVPPSLAALLDRPSQFEEIGGTLDELRKALG
ncbi:MAG: threonine synthase [Gammaproteobacteria bacterium]|jgi:threonine synthase|nr:threonine synthase [Gammaproteobacteria bacterium]NDB24557.1 threonine synthase [Gammaproteobacteria bacterium]NDF86055.1 threonine synthase [Gammaproteobacteria bacterium]